MIGATFGELFMGDKPLIGEILLIDDGSEDDTVPLKALGGRKSSRAAAQR